MSTILIGFDAFDRQAMERLLDKGDLPNLGRIVDEGFYAGLEPRPSDLQAFPWPAFLQGRSVTEYEWFSVKQWSGETMRIEVKDLERLPFGAFPDVLASRGYRVALVDVPFMTRPAEGFDGVCLQGWQTHDQFERYSYPKELWGEMRRRFGPPRIAREVCAPQSPDRLRALRKVVLETTDQFGEMCASLLEREPWDLFMAAFGTIHRVGHYLWDASRSADRPLDPTARAELAHAADDVHRRCDQALGRILESAPEGSRIVTFALHGMRPETGWPELFPRILGQIQGIGAPPPSGTGMLFRLKQMVPTPVVQRLTTWMSFKTVSRVVPLWSKHMYDWSRVRCFPLPGGDSNNLIRINLKGREAEGTVAPGREYDELCDAIEEGLLSFRDIETGAPVVDKVVRLSSVVEGLDVAHTPLPDLVVHWRQVPAFDTTGVRSPVHGEVRWEKGWKVASGRSGDHSPRGWLAAAGPGIPHASRDDAFSVAALGQTVLRWFDAQGEGDGVRPSIDDLTGADSAAPTT
jgi:predicted AlkP superfamily phosphohydrolase/phosphomutase